jgi:hypothetical protein
LVNLRTICQKLTAGQPNTGLGRKLLLNQLESLVGRRKPGQKWAAVWPDSGLGGKISTTGTIMNEFEIISQGRRGLLSLNL